MHPAHVPLSFKVVSPYAYIHDEAAAYIIGSLQECRKWILLEGMRAETVIIPL